MPRLTIKVDPDLCIGAASCVTVAPETFRLNDENKAFEVSEEEKENIILSAQSCPTLAVIILDEAGNQIYPI